MNNNFKHCHVSAYTMTVSASKCWFWGDNRQTSFTSGQHVWSTCLQLLETSCEKISAGLKKQIPYKPKPEILLLNYLPDIPSDLLMVALHMIIAAR